MTLGQKLAMDQPASRPHVLHILQSFDIGGLEQLVLRLVEGGNERGFDSSVVAIVEDGPMREQFEAADARTFVIPKRDRVDLSLLPRLLQTVRSVSADVIHSHHLGPFLYGAPVARLLGLPHVHTEHSREFYDVGRRRLAGRWMSRVADTTCVSYEIADWHEAQFGARPTVIVNGVQLQRSTVASRAAARRKLGIDAHTPLVGYLGRLAAEKAPVDLLRAFALLRRAEPDAQLVFIGDGPERGAVEDAIHELDLGGVVTLLGRRSDVAELLPAFDVLGMPSLREGLPLAALEAMATGIPVVASSVGELPRLLGAGGGVCVEPRDTDGFARAMGAFLRSPDRAAREGLRGYENVRANYGYDAMLDAYAARWSAGAQRSRSAA